MRVSSKKKINVRVAAYPLLKVSAYGEDDVNSTIVLWRRIYPTVVSAKVFLAKNYRMHIAMKILRGMALKLKI